MPSVSIFTPEPMVCFGDKNACFDYCFLKKPVAVQSQRIAMSLKSNIGR